MTVTYEDGRPVYSQEIVSDVLAQLQREIKETNIKLGWRGGPTEASFGEAMMLLVSEVSEAFEAWRKWGLEDATANHGKAIVVPGSECGKPPGMYLQGYELPKPEGVGSEFADVLIRLLDDCDMFGIDLAAEVRRKMEFNKMREFRHGGKRL